MRIILESPSYFLYKGKNLLGEYKSVEILLKTAQILVENKLAVLKEITVIIGEKTIISFNGNKLELEIEK